METSFFQYMHRQTPTLTTHLGLKSRLAPLPRDGATGHWNRTTQRRVGSRFSQSHFNLYLSLPVIYSARMIYSRWKLDCTEIIVNPIDRRRHGVSQRQQVAPPIGSPSKRDSISRCGLDCQRLALSVRLTHLVAPNTPIYTTNVRRWLLLNISRIYSQF